MIFFPADRSTNPSEASGKIRRLLLVKSSTAQTDSSVSQEHRSLLHRSSLPALELLSRFPVRATTAEERWTPV